MLTLGLTLAEIDELTIGEMYDLITAKVNANIAQAKQQEELIREKKEEEVLGRWASKPEDFKLLSLGGA